MKFHLLPRRSGNVKENAQVSLTVRLNTSIIKQNSSSEFFIILISIKILVFKILPLLIKIISMQNAPEINFNRQNYL